MSPAIKTQVPPEPSGHQQGTTQHQYGTRIRSHSVIKPSPRFRNSPDPSPAPRRIRPAPTPKFNPVADPKETAQVEMPQFPPPHVMLHLEDANSKVLLAIGRSFLSVDNKAMTIKDLADMTIKYGLSCQNVSAAGQAITTYIRTHMQRCEAQQDHPLLLRHILSGTPDDDDLVPALYSRTGGAHCMLNPTDNRITNFRRGTMVWYLSKAAGLPCPFQRAGIRPCDYSENGKVGSAVNPGKERKRERDRLRRAERCGQKRKRLLRACANNGFDSDSSGEQPPPKIKLTLRLHPTLASIRNANPTGSPISSPESVMEDLDSDSDSMSVNSSESEEDKAIETSWSLPPYPRRSISIPSYTPSADDHLPSALHAPQKTPSVYWRSSSVPYCTESVSPPPDSEEEDEDFHLSMANARRRSCSRATESVQSDDSFFANIDDAETQWGESPGPMSPPTQFEDEEVQVKQEPHDVRGLLDVWENVDSTIVHLGVVDVPAQATLTSIEHDLPKPKIEELEHWAWKGLDDVVSDSMDDGIKDDSIVIKTEDMDTTILLSDSPCAIQTDSPTATLADTETSDERVTHSPSSELFWKDAELLGPDSVKPHDLENGQWYTGSARSSFSEPQHVQNSTQSQLTNLSLHPETRNPDWSPSRRDGKPPQQSCNIPQCASGSTPRKAHTSPRFSRVVQRSADRYIPAACERVVHTCEPCVPPISATQFEGVSVYQMSLGSATTILRRVDTDFVNISPIVDHFGFDLPEATHLPFQVVVKKGSSAVRGVWVSLADARNLFHDKPILDVFLSDTLLARFPPTLQDLSRTSVQSRSSKEYGPHFRSTVMAKQASRNSHRLEHPPQDGGAPWERGMVSHWDVEDHLLSVHPSFTFIPSHSPPPEDKVTLQTPLSPAEEEIFHSLCVAPEWELATPTSLPQVTEAPVPTTEAPTSANDPQSEAMRKDTPLETPRTEATCPDRNLRRSKRVANASLSRPRTRSSKRESRASLL